MTTLNRREFLFSLGAFPFFWRARNPSIAGIRFRAIRHGRSAARRYLHIHGNEGTARDVLVEHMRSARGVAHLVKSQHRYVPILGGRIDPNRMFSREGAEKSLKAQNPAWGASEIRRALDALEKDRPGFLRAIRPPAGGLLISLHNNGPGYSVTDEVPISDAAALNNPERPREFLLVTHARDFEALRRSPFNAVLQENPKGDEDGSLSRLAVRWRFRYLNIECPLGDAEAQRLMLAWAEKNLA